MASAESPTPTQLVLVRHMARSPRTRTMRAARSGHRRQGVLLDDGTRIRKKGKRRYTEVDLAALASNHQRFLEFVRVGTIEVCDPVTEQAYSYEELVAKLKALAGAIDESGVNQDAVLGSDQPENSAPSIAPPPMDDLPPADPGVPELDETNGLTEEELLKMNRKDLDKVAKKDYGVEDPDKLPNKQAVVEAIFAASEEE